MLKYKINFYLYKESLTKPGYFSIRAYISYAGKRPYVYTGIYVNRGEWDAKSQRVDSKDSIENLHINDVEKIIRDIFKDYDYHEERYPSPKELKDTFDNRYKRKLPDEEVEERDNIIIKVYEKIEEFMSEVGHREQWTDSNYNRYNKLKNHFKFYNEELDLAKLTEDDLMGLIKYFQTEPKGLNGKGEIVTKEAHKNTTVSRSIKDVRTFLRWAKKKEYYFGDLHDTFKPKFKGLSSDLNELVFFTWEELMKFYHHEFDSNQEHLEHVRDVIAFCCFSSLRFSDVETLKRSHIRKNHFISTTQKTTDPLMIDINDFTREILNKYKDFYFDNDLALPVVSQQKTNEHLKEIGRILEFNDMITNVYFVGNKRYEDSAPKWAHISTHIGRRTFIVNAIYLKIPETVIMKWTGHKDYESMKPYIAVVDELKVSEMNKFNIKKHVKN
ncbi:TPA: site-specific integrase [Elizabethkingia anophelis]